ncbi:MAG TPA: YfhO family protein [bacterium]|nr:YfhO family protein [bacterium]
MKHQKEKQPQKPEPARQFGPDIPDSRLNGIAIVLFAVLPILFYGKYLFGSNMLFGTDWLGAGSYMWREFMATYIRTHGNVALWWPALLCGQPTVAGFFADMFYPTLLLRLFLPVHVVWTWTFVIHHFLAGLGTYLFLRELKLSVLPAALGGLAYEFAGSLITLAYAGHDGRLIGSALMPLALFFLHRGMTRRQFVWFALMGFVIAMQLFSGHVQKVYYTGLMLFAWFLFMVIRTATQEKSVSTVVKLTAYFGIGAGLGAAIAAIQYLPVYGNMAFASRGGERGYAYASSWSMPIIETFDLLTPKFSGGLDSYWSANVFKLHSEYLGIIPLLFAFVAVWRRWKDRNVKFFTFSFVGALLMAWGGNTPFYYIPYYLFPGISKFRGPAMIFFLAAFSLVVLAGLGIDHVLRRLKDDDGGKTTKTVLTFGAIPVALLLLFATLKGPLLSLLGSTTIHTSEKLQALANNYPNMLSGFLLAVVFAALAFMLVRLLVSRRATPTAFAAGIAAVMILDMGLSLNLWNPSRGYVRGVPSPDAYFTPDEAVTFLKQDTSLYRVLPWQYERTDDGILAYNGIQSVAGQMPNPLQDYQDFTGAGSSVFFRPDNMLIQNFMDLSNVKYVISVVLPQDVSRYDERTRQVIQQIRVYFNQSRFEPVFAGQKYAVYRNKTVLPRAFIASGYRVVRDKDEVLNTLTQPSFNPAQTVLLYKNPGFAAGTDSSAGTAQVSSYDCNEVKVKASLTAPGLLVLTDNYVPDWKVYVDGKKSELLQAYHTFRAVALTAGQHDVAFRYESKYYKLGSYVSLLGIIFLCVVLVIGLIRSRRTRVTTLGGQAV